LLDLVQSLSSVVSIRSLIKVVRQDNTGFFNLIGSLLAYSTSGIEVFINKRLHLLHLLGSLFTSHTLENSISLTKNILTTNSAPTQRMVITELVTLSSSHIQSCTSPNLTHGHILTDKPKSSKRSGYQSLSSSYG